MGDPACWLHLVCDACGRVDDDLDAMGHCTACRDQSPPAPANAGESENSNSPGAPER